jgi:hypothetical protein
MSALAAHPGETLIPVEAEHHLRLAGGAYHNPDVAEQHLEQAFLLAPDHSDVLIGFYRFYFYQGRLSDALRVACACLEHAARLNALCGDWRAVRAADAAFGLYEAALPRFYLFTLKAYAYLKIRLGELAEGRAAVDKLLELDADDKVGARVLIEVLDRLEAGDDE